jgi:dTDP-4-amino-4,6-dideoxygalactose transaminase
MHFLLRGARIIFADSMENHPNIDAQKIEPLINKKTKAIVVVHYAGIACDMDKILDLCEEYNLLCIEDAAQAIGSKYKGQVLGTLSDLAAFSFHETKNIICGEGGLLTINNQKFAARAEIIWEKGTNRSAYFRGEVDKYNWVDIGSSFLPSELNSAFLYGQLKNAEAIS